MAIATWMMKFTLYPCGQHISWKSWQVFEGAFTPAINSVSETIFLLILKIHDLMMATLGSWLEFYEVTIPRSTFLFFVVFKVVEH